MSIPPFWGSPRKQELRRFWNNFFFPVKDTLGDRRQCIHDLVRQLRDRKRMTSLQDSSRTVHSSPKKVAQLLRDIWSGVMGGKRNVCATLKAYHCQGNYEQPSRFCLNPSLKTWCWWPWSQ